MKAYLAISGTVFGLIPIAHVARVIQEGAERAKDPWFIAITLFAVGLSVWAWCLFGKAVRS